MTPESVSRPRLPRGFVTDTIASLARIEESGRATNNHLARLNGTVARHEKEIGEFKLKLAEERGAKDQVSKARSVVVPVLTAISGALIGALATGIVRYLFP